MKRIFLFFDKFEDRVRGHLSRYPILYTLVGGVAIVLFWRGVWHTADILEARGGLWAIVFFEPVSLIIVTLILLATGLFVSYFIGDAILLSGARSQKKLAEKTDKEIREEESTLAEIKGVMEEIKEEVGELKREVRHEHQDHVRHVIQERGESVLQKEEK